MKRIQTAFLITVAIIFVSCAPTQNTTGVWVNKDKMQGKTYHNIFIIAMTADIQARVQLETDIANLITSRGLKAVKSVEAMPPSLNDPKMPTKDEIVSKVKGSGCDAVFIASLLKKEDNVNYTAGHEGNTVVPGASYYGFYTYTYSTVSTPGYVTQNKVYYIQSNLYDAATEEKMWSVQSEVFNPSSLQKFSKYYLMKLVNQLEEQKVIKKQDD